MLFPKVFFSVNKNCFQTLHFQLREISVALYKICGICRQNFHFYVRVYSYLKQQFYFTEMKWKFHFQRQYSMRTNNKNLDSGLMDYVLKYQDVLHLLHIESFCPLIKIKLLNCWQRERSGSSDLSICISLPYPDPDPNFVGFQFYNKNEVG